MLICSTESSYVGLTRNIHEKITLNMNITFIGHDAPIPDFRCTFSYGKKIMDEKICNASKNDFSLCKLEKIFEPDDDVPYRCEIFFNNTNFLVWADEFIHLNPGWFDNLLKYFKFFILS